MRPSRWLSHASALRGATGTSAAISASVGPAAGAISQRAQRRSQPSSSQSGRASNWASTSGSSAQRLSNVAMSRGSVWVSASVSLAIRIVRSVEPAIRAASAPLSSSVRWANSRASFFIRTILAIAVGMRALLRPTPTHAKTAASCSRRSTASGVQRSLGAMRASARLARRSTSAGRSSSGGMGFWPFGSICRTTSSSKSKFANRRASCSPFSAPRAAVSAPRPASPSAAISQAVCRITSGVTPGSIAIVSARRLSCTVGLRRPEMLPKGRM